MLLSHHVFYGPTVNHLLDVTSAEKSLEVTGRRFLWHSGRVKEVTLAAGDETGGQPNAADWLRCSVPVSLLCSVVESGRKQRSHWIEYNRQSNKQKMQIQWENIDCPAIWRGTDHSGLQRSAVISVWTGSETAARRHWRVAAQSLHLDSLSTHTHTHVDLKLTTEWCCLHLSNVLQHLATAGSCTQPGDCARSVTVKSSRVLQIWVRVWNPTAV